MKTSLKLIAYSLQLSSVLFLTGCQNPPLYKDNRVLMGTYVEVVSPDKRAGEIVFAEIKRLEGLLSKYIPESEVAQLNKAGELRVSKDTFYLIKQAKEFSEKSNGAFDITIAPLLDAWGFTDKHCRLPKESEVQEALKLVGSDKILLNDADNMVKFKLSGMKIDLGAIAKGFALDCAVKKLKENNISSCLINAGGQVFCLGDKFGRPWNIAIRDPRSSNVKSALELKDQSVSTSGDYEQFFLEGNKRYSHIFNPKTGFPADSGIIAVTVIAPSGLTADCLSTAIFILGKDKGVALAKEFPGTRVMIYE